MKRPDEPLRLLEDADAPPALAEAVRAVRGRDPDEAQLTRMAAALGIVAPVPPAPPPPAVPPSAGPMAGAGAAGAGAGAASTGAVGTGIAGGGIAGAAGAGATVGIKLVLAGLVIAGAVAAVAVDGGRFGGGSSGGRATPPSTPVVQRAQPRAPAVADDDRFAAKDSPSSPAGGDSPLADPVAGPPPFAAPAPAATPVPAHRRRAARPVTLPTPSVALTPRASNTPPTTASPSASASAARSAQEPTSAPAAATTEAASRLREEAALVRRAERLLTSDPSTALRLTEERKRRFPGGALDQEAEVVAIDALLRLGRRTEAALRAHTFEAAHAGSLHARRIHRLMGE